MLIRLTIQPQSTRSWFHCILAILQVLFMVHHIACPLNSLLFDTKFEGMSVEDQAYFAHYNSLSESKRAEVQKQRNNNKKSNSSVSWAYILRTMTNHPLYSILFRSSEYWTRWCLVGWLCWLIAFRITMYLARQHD